MRLWSLHPSLLDRAALVAGWREALLAQAVLAGRTKGYRSHPQLQRFAGLEARLPALAAYLHGLRDEATRRGYRFDLSRIDVEPVAVSIPVTSGQLMFELEHLRQKVRIRQPEWEVNLTRASPHPVFTEVPGAVEVWERGA